MLPYRTGTKAEKNKDGCGPGHPEDPDTAPECCTKQHTLYCEKSGEKSNDSKKDGSSDVP